MSYNNDISNNSIKNNDDCKELKSIAYKTMLMNGNNINPKYENNNSNKINNFLENDSIAKKKESWNKLDKSEKLNKLFEYSKEYKITNSLDNSYIEKLNNFFIRCLDRKLLLKSKEVIYNIEINKITNIPNLLLNKDNNNFYLKKDDKHVSTIKNLPPEKKNKVKTIKIHE